MLKYLNLSKIHIIKTLFLTAFLFSAGFSLQKKKVRGVGLSNSAITFFQKLSSKNTASDSLSF